MSDKLTKEEIRKMKSVAPTWMIVLGIIFSPIAVAIFWDTYKFLAIGVGVIPVLLIALRLMVRRIERDQAEK